VNFSPQTVAKIAASNFVDQIKKGCLTIDNSEYITWNSCFVQGLYYGGLRRVNARSRAPLAFGSAVHAGLDVFLKACTLKRTGRLESYSGPDDPVHGWRHVAMKTAEKEKLDDCRDPRRNTRTLQELLASYCLEYVRKPDMQFAIIDIEGAPAVERSFVVPLGIVTVETVNWGTIQVEIMWSGKIDALTSYEGYITPIDHKTTTVMGERFVDDKLRSSQFLGYTYAARYLSEKLFNSRAVFGARINALALRSGGFEFRRFDIPYPDWKVAEWQVETLQAVKQLILNIDQFLQTGSAVPIREHCVTKYGRCSYFDACDIPVNMRDRMVFDDSYFFVSNWSPLGAE